MANQNIAPAKPCSRLDDCWKVKIVLDKQYDAEGIYGMVIKAVCDKCKEKEEEHGTKA